MKKGNKDNKEVSTNKIIILLIAITALLLFVVAFAFVTFERSQAKSDKKIVNTGVISVTYANNENGIKLDNYIPIADDVGKKLNDKSQYFDFTINSEIVGDTTINYEVVLEKSSNCNLDNKFIKVYLEKENDGTYSKVVDPKPFTAIKKSEVGSPKGTMVLVFGTYTSNSSDKYRLRAWVDEGAMLDSNVVCDLGINVYAKPKN